MRRYACKGAADRGAGRLVVNVMQDPGEQVDMDFRSARFRDQACALERMTGCPLALCR